MPIDIESATLTTNQPSPSGFIPASVSVSLASGTGERAMRTSSRLL